MTRPYILGVLPPWRAFLLALALSNCSLGASAESADKFVLSSLTDRLTLLQTAGGNSVLSQGEDGLLLADCDDSRHAELLQRQLESLARGQALVYLVNTHWHPDRTGANPLLGEQALILAHENVRTRVSAPQQLATSIQKVEAMDPAGWPVITFQRQLELYFNGDRITITHYPGGHTDGDSTLYFHADNVLLTGDLYVPGEFPFVDLNAGGNAVQLARNVNALLASIDAKTLVIPGRGATGDLGDLTTYAAMLNQTIDEIRKLKILGMSLRQVQLHGLSQKWQPWGAGKVDQSTWIRLAYQSL